jgi:hypothetical protein
MAARLAAACALTLCLMAPAGAAAQEQEGLAPGEQAFLVLSSSTTTSGGVITVGYVLLGEREKRLEQEIRVLQVVGLLDDYLEANEAAVQMALALGAGDELDELVALLGHEGALTQEQRLELRARRAELRALVARQDPRPLADAFGVYAIFARVLWDHHVAEVTR